MGVRIKPKRKQPRGANVKGTVKRIQDAISYAKPKPQTMNAGLSTTEAKRRLENMRGDPNTLRDKARRLRKKGLKQTIRLNKKIDRQMGD